MYRSLYRNELVTPDKAVERVKDGSLLIYGALLAEPPALLGALAIIDLAHPDFREELLRAAEEMYVI
jgi:acyl-CoA hydrolase